MFCDFCASLGDAVQAARQAGYPAGTAAGAAARLLRRQEVRAALERKLADRSALRTGQAVIGLERIAFGAVGDVVKLLTQGERLSDEQIGELDLFCVSELRRGKDGGFDVKLYNRLEALELLLSHGGSGTGAQSLFAALEQSARLVDEPARGDDAV